MAAQLSVDEKETTELVLELVSVADKNGLRLPREFGFLLKQVLVCCCQYIIYHVLELYACSVAL